MDRQFIRYERQILLPEIGTAGQCRLARASVLVVGAGGLGAPALQYLAAAGVGHIGVVDGDAVSESNLNRQILYGGDDIGGKKADLAVERLRRINGEIKISAIPEALTDDNACEIIRGYSALALCADSLGARKTANRACAAANVPFVDGAVNRFHGTVMTVVPGETPCYECVYGHSAQSGEIIPVLGAMAGWVGCAQAMAAIRLLLGADDPSRGAILLLDGNDMTTERIPVEKNPRCAVCGRL